MEKIFCAAVKIIQNEGAYPLIICGHRHADCWETAHEHHITYLTENTIQGFLTDSNRFVDRYEAKKIAVAANQLIVPIEETYAELYSEDIY